MSLHAIAHGLMRAAALAAPKDRADWARAMQAELATMEGGGSALGWSAGCLATALGWRLQAEAVFVLALVAVAVVEQRVVEPATLRFLPQGLISGYFYLIFLTLPAIAAGIVAAARPDRFRTVALMMPVLLVALTEVNFYLASGKTILNSSGWVVFDAPPVVGYIALLGACYFGASEGARVRRRGARA